MSTNDKYFTMYTPSINISLPDGYHSVSISDIVSITFIHNYDTMTYPIIRIRLYSDISLIQTICDYPDDIEVRGLLSGMIYRTNTNEKSPKPVKPVKEISFRLKGYIEKKNIPTSKFDQYDMGIKKNTDLNTNVKVPIEIYCYKDRLIHLMKQKTPSIYKNMSITSVISDIFNRSEIYDYSVDPLDNQNKYNQILIPNLNVLDTLGFLDKNYGLYKKGAQLYGDIDKIYICNTNVINNTNPLSIYIENSKSNSTIGGMQLSGNKFQMCTLPGNISIKTETDIERVLNGKYLSDINLSTMNVKVEELNELFDMTKEYASLKNIEVPSILHKSKNEYVASSYVARLNESITNVDLSGTGFDIGQMNVNSRYNFIFSSAIRGLNINKRYRPTYVCHVLSNTDSNLFIAQTTMNLRTN